VSDEEILAAIPALDAARACSPNRRGAASYAGLVKAVAEAW